MGFPVTIKVNYQSHTEHHQWEIEQQEMINDKAQDEWLDKLNEHTKSEKPI